MAKNTPQTPPRPGPGNESAIQLGAIHLTMANGRLYARHARLTDPVEIDAKQIERMVMRQLREQIA